MEELTGLSKSQITLSQEGLSTLIKSYCRWASERSPCHLTLFFSLRESGVRNLRKQIEKIYRKAAFKVGC